MYDELVTKDDNKTILLGINGEWIVDSGASFTSKMPVPRMNNPVLKFFSFHLLLC